MKLNKKGKIILMIYIVSICLLCMINFKIDPDYLWHIKAGEYMFKNGILKHDIFSWSMNGKYWMSHEWLFELFIYFLKTIFGKAHIFVYCLLTIGLLMSILYYTNKSNFYKNKQFSVIWLSLFVICMLFVQVRPHMLSFSFLAITIYLLFDLYKNKNSKKIYFLPFVSILWSNVHGGSSNLPYILCIIFVICGLFNFKFSKIESKKIDKIQIKRYIIVMILCMLGVCFNIHGFKMFIYPYQNMLDKNMLSNILEWRSTSLNELSHYIYIIFVLFIFSVFLLSKKRISLIDFILFGFCVFLGIKSVRFWFYTYIVMTYIVFNYISKNDDEKIVNIGMMFFSIAFIFVFFINIHVLFPKNYSYELDSKDINYLKKIKPKKLYNSYNFGGDLVYNDIKVFIDGRADLYGDSDVFKDYISINGLDGDFYSLLYKYGFDYYLIDKNSNIDYFMRYSDMFNLLYMNGNIKIYEKKN